MYLFLREPVITGVKEVGCHDHVHIMATTLEGSDQRISAVAWTRLRDIKCHQLPHTAFPPKYRVAITYVVGEADFLAIQTVAVSFGKSTPWSCFYDVNSGRVGTKKLGGGENAHFHFLNEDDLKVIIGTLQNALDAPALSRMVQKGSAGVPEIEDEPASDPVLDENLERAERDV